MAFANPRSIVKSLGIGSGQTVVDIGAGSGAYVESLAESVGGSGTVYAIEIQKELVAKLGSLTERPGLKVVKPLWADAEILGGTTLPDNVADWVLLANVLSLSGQRYTLAKEIARILKPSGKLALIDWQDSFGGLGPAKDSVVTAAEAEKIFNEAGFTKIDVLPQAGDHHYGLIFTLTKKQ